MSNRQYFSRKDDQKYVENSGFVKTCDEHVHRIQFREELSGPVRAVFDHANRLNAGPDLSVDKSSSEKSDFCLGLSSF